MSLRDILVFLDENHCKDDRVNLAMTIARNRRAFLDGVFLRTNQTANTPHPVVRAARRRPNSDLPAISLDGLDPASQAEIVEQRFQKSLRTFGIKGDWHVLDPLNTADAIALAQTVDLTVIGQPAPEPRRSPQLHPAEIVVACGQPVLVVPYAGRFDNIGHRVLVAWDGTPEATRALNHAIPLISDAHAVTVATVQSRNNESPRGCPPIERVIRHLARHGIAARSEKLTRGDIGVCDILLSRSADFGADLIVAGAYIIPRSARRSSAVSAASCSSR
jgi:nucleotide-binding universal stress UspA family protein